MVAAFVRKTGPASEIQVGNVPTPTVGPADVLIRMAATAVNHVDLFVRSGAYPTALPLPFVIGRDVVGTVKAVGTDVDPSMVGQRVWSNSLGHDGRQGTFSELVLAPGDRVYPLPGGVDPATAASVLHPAGTAYLGLVREAHLRSGETVLVAGAGGAVGSAVVQMACAAGARVVATAAPKDFEWCSTSGADVVLDYRDPDLATQIAISAPDGVDVWWDNSGRNDLAQALPLMRQGGRVVVMAGMGSMPQFRAGDLYTRDLRILGFAISNASVPDLAQAARVINDLLSDDRLRVRTGSVLDLSRAREAHELMEAGGHVGRVVVTP
nr:NADPH:quinone reductase [uncultured Nocardioides sp.]